MSFVKMIPEPFDTTNLSTAVYKATIKTISDISFLDESIPNNAGLVSVRVPLKWENEMNLTQFRKIENLVFLERPLMKVENKNLPNSIRLTSEKDADSCAEIAGKCFHQDRYHTDQKIDNDAADKSKRNWAKNNILGRGDVGFVAEINNKIVGFNLCLIQNNSAVIDLIGVELESQGMGIGKSLVMASISYYSGKVPSIQVGTQTTNKSALAIYKAAGFSIVHESATFHWTPENLENIP
jgi:ribosomal protein S18 acetylase RimI-like enzyme